MGPEVICGTYTLSEHRGPVVELKLLKNKFSSVANSRSPCTPVAGLLQPLKYFIPCQTSFALFCPISI